MFQSKKIKKLENLLDKMTMKIEYLELKYDFMYKNPPTYINGMRITINSIEYMISKVEVIKNSNNQPEWQYRAMNVLTGIEVHI